MALNLNTTPNLNSMAAGLPYNPENGRDNGKPATTGGGGRGHSRAASPDEDCCTGNTSRSSLSLV